MLVDLLLMLQYLFTRWKFTIFQLHLLLLSHLLQLLWLQLYLLHLLVKWNALLIHKTITVSMTHRRTFLSELLQIINHFRSLIRSVINLSRLLSSASHLSRHFFCLLKILQSHHPGIARLNFLVLDTSVLPDHLFNFLFIHLFYHFKKLFPFILINSR